MELSAVSADRGLVPRVDHDGALLAQANPPVECHCLDGSVHLAGYDEFAAVSANRWAGRAEWRQAGRRLSVADEWSVEDGGRFVLVRRTFRAGGSDQAEAVQLRLSLAFASAGPIRPFVPGMVYSPSQWEAGRLYSYADHRLAYPVAAAYRPQRADVVALERVTPATFDARPDRVPGQRRYLQRTDIGSTGFSTSATDPAALTLHVAWPYHEGETSAMLDAKGSPALAYFPLGDGPVEIRLVYRLRLATAADYADAVAAVFTAVVDHTDPRPSVTPVSLPESVDLRLDSAARTYRVWDGGFAGFVLNFDPERGYESEAKAFGASFADHQMAGSRDILEYGFTGRQLNLAYMLAKRDPAGWLDRGGAVVDSFVERMCTPSGWVYTLWHAGKGRPLYACGDPSGAVMHYLGRSDQPGAYTRMMAEAGFDLLLNVSLHRACGRERTAWRDAGLRLADFFVRRQDDDGAWRRAYTPDGEAVTGGEWFGATPEASKTATSAVVPFLLAAAREAEPERAADYRTAARRAGEHILAHESAADDYRGGTLDNPNLVDKEAAFLVMRAALALHVLDGEPRWLDAARRAAAIAVTWHSIWPVPNIPDTPLARAGVRSVGWGGINTVWGVGVTDIYSLFFAADLVRLSGLTGNPLFRRMAELIACSSLQLLAVPGAPHGFADAGMQPEGIAFCDQGADDGLIHKGDTWGGLGWPYTAGTYGLTEYLAARTDSSAPAAT